MDTQRQKWTLFLVGAICIIFPACSANRETTGTNSKPPQDTTDTDQTVATVEVTGIHNITKTTATVDARVLKKGSAAVTERGVCWDSVGIPTTKNTHKTATSVQANGAFTVDLNNMNTSTTYNVRAYANSDAGTGYSDTVYVTPLPNPINVDPSAQYQQFQGWGTSLAWFANVLGGTDDEVRNRYADLIFDREKGLGLNIVRYNIGGGENPDYDFMEPRADVPGFEPKPGNYDWTADQNQRWFLKAAIKRGVNLVEGFSNSPPFWMTQSGSVTGAQGGGNNLKPEYYQDFADYLLKVDQYFKNNLNVDFYSLEPFNEPVSSWWTYGGRQEGCHFSRGAQNDFLKIFAPALEKQDPETHLAVSDENSIDQTVDSFNYFDESIKEQIDQINTHSYNGSQRSELHQLAQQNNKELWVSEYGDGDGSGLTMSEVILNDLKIMHARAWTYWQVVDGGGWGMLVTNLNGSPPYDFHYNKKYYVMANYSKFIRPGDVIVQIDDKQSVAAFDASDHRLTIVTTNNISQKMTKRFHITSSQAVDNAAERYRTVGKELKKASVKLLNDHELLAKLPPESVTTYVFNNVTHLPVKK